MDRFKVVDRTKIRRRTREYFVTEEPVTEARARQLAEEFNGHNEKPEREWVVVPAWYNIE